MATGDLDAVIENRDVGNRYYGSIVRVTGNVYVLLTCSSNNLEYQTRTIDDAGDIGNAVIDTMSKVSANNATPNVGVKVNGNIFAHFFNGGSPSPYINCATVQVDNDGSIGATTIALQTYGTNSGRVRFVNQAVEVGDSGSAKVYAIPYEDTWDASVGFRIRTTSISYDGATITKVADSSRYESGSSAFMSICRIFGTKYAVMFCRNGATPKLYTFDITSAGVITYIDSQAIDAGNGLNLVACNVQRISNSVIACLYTTSATNKIRLKTIAIDGSGNIGADIDTDDALFTNDSLCLVCKSLGSDVYLYGVTLTTGNHQYVRSIHIASDGTIGAQQDELDLQTDNAQYVDILKAKDTGNLYVGYRLSGGTTFHWATFGAETAYPSLLKLSSNKKKLLASNLI